MIWLNDNILKPFWTLVTMPVIYVIPVSPDLCRKLYYISTLKGI